MQIKNSADYYQVIGDGLKIDSGKISVTGDQNLTINNDHPYGIAVSQDDVIDAMTYCTNDIMTTLRYTTHSTYPSIENVIFNGPATIVFWSDGDKTIVKCAYDDYQDPEKGLAMAIVKKFMGNCSFMKKWIELKCPDDYKSNCPEVKIGLNLNNPGEIIAEGILNLNKLMKKGDVKENEQLSRVERHRKSYDK